jgi:hypothetical protein
MYKYYGDLFRELRELSNVYVYQGNPGNWSELLSKSNVEFDAIIFGLGYFAQSDVSFFGELHGLKEASPVKVSMFHKPQNLFKEKVDFCNKNEIDIFLDYFDNGKHSTSSRIVKSWFTATPKYFKPRDIPVKYDIGFQGALHGKGKIKGPAQDLRSRIGDFLSKANRYNTYWKSTHDLSYRTHSTDEYASRMNECKIWLTTTGEGNNGGPRYFEVALSKTLLFCNNMPSVNGDIFVDGETCVVFKNDLSDFEEKLNFYLTNEEERNKIIDNAFELVNSKYTWKHMAENLLLEIKSYKDLK